MTASRALAAQLGVSEAACEEIDIIHKKIDKYISRALARNYSEHMVKKVLTEYEEELQRLWEFPIDSSFHTYFKHYKFKKKWYARSFRCNSTGQIFTVPMSVGECQFFQWGHAYLDTGRLDSYARLSNCTEIVSDNTKGNNI